MFKNKKTKQKSLDIVDNLLSTYLQVSDKKILKSKDKNNKGHQASKIIEMNTKLGNFKKTKDGLKKYKQKERKIRNKEMKKAEKMNERIIRQSKIDKGDESLITDIMNSKLKDLKKLDLVSKDSELINLQNDILNLTNTNSTKKKLKDLKDKQLLANKRRNAKMELFNEKVSKGYISINGLTPGLAQPGDDDSDEESDEDDGDEYNNNNNNIIGFKDDFDDFN